MTILVLGTYQYVVLERILLLDTLLFQSIARRMLYPNIRIRDDQRHDSRRFKNSILKSSHDVPVFSTSFFDARYFIDIWSSERTYLTA
jgi:hypothetical protein